MFYTIYFNHVFSSPDSSYHPFLPFLCLSLFVSHTMVSKAKNKNKKKTEKSVTMKQKAHKQKTEFTLFWQSTPEYGTWNVSNIPNVYKMRKIVFLLPSHIICRGFLS